MSRSLALLCSLVVAALVIVGGAASKPRPTSYVLPGNATFPEGVAFDQKSGDFYVSSTGDGSVLRGNVNRPAAETFISATGVQFSAIGVKIDGDRLLVAGGSTGQVRIYDRRSDALRRTFETGPGGFLNDLAVTRDGSVYVTDSSRPVLWRIAPGSTTIEQWLALPGYQSGFNANGIVATKDGRYLVYSQTNTGQLWRVELATRSVTAIDLGGELVAGDGLALRGHTLFAVAAGLIVKVRLAGDFASGQVVSRTGDPSFRSPTTLAIARGRLLVVNSQFDAMGGTPVLPFTVSSVRIP